MKTSYVEVHARTHAHTQTQTHHDTLFGCSVERYCTSSQLPLCHHVIGLAGAT